MDNKVRLLKIKRTEQMIQIWTAMQTFPAFPTFPLLSSSSVWHVTAKTELR